MAAQHLAATKIQSAIRQYLWRRNMDAIIQAKMNGQEPPYHLLFLGIKKSQKAPVSKQPIGYNLDGST